MSMSVWSAGLRAPSAGAEVVREQMHRAHRYRNALTEIERDRRRAVRAVIYEQAPPELRAQLDEIDQLEAWVDDAWTDVRRARGRDGDAAERDTRADQARNLTAELARVRRASAPLRTLLMPSLSVALEEIRDRARARVRGARAASGVYWGTYLLVEAAAQTAARQRSDPHWSSWTGDGAIAVQLQPPLATALVLAGTGTRLRIERGDARPAWQPDRACDQRRAARGLPPRPGPQAPASDRDRVLRIRVGSEGRSPVWASFPMVYDRELPLHAVARWAKVLRRRVGSHDRWQLQITLELPERPQAAPRSGRIGLDVGWRRSAGDVRVAVLATEGRDLTLPATATADLRAALRPLASETDAPVATEVVLPPAILRGLRGVRATRARRDVEFEATRDALIADLTRLAAPGERGLAGITALPAWLREAIAGRGEQSHIARWRSTRRLARVALEWRRRMVEESEEYRRLRPAYDALERWRAHDRHLLDYESEQRAQSMGRRDALYRALAAHLARSYGEVLVEDMRHPGFAAYSETRQRLAIEAGCAPTAAAIEEDTDDGAQYRIARSLAAPGRLRVMLRQACAREGARYIEEEAAGTTITCWRCGGVNEWDARADVWHRCGGCGAEWDQDANASRVMLGRERSSDAGPDVDRALAGTPRISERARKRSEGKARRAATGAGGARTVVPGSAGS